jgi:hypothetical protein
MCDNKTCLLCVNDNTKNDLLPLSDIFGVNGPIISREKGDGKSNLSNFSN